MTIAEKITRAKNDCNNVYNSGKFAILNESKYMHPTVSGEMLGINDVNSLEHSLDINLSSKNLATAQQIYEGATSYDVVEFEGRTAVRFVDNVSNSKCGEVFKPNTQYTVSLDIRVVKREAIEGNSGVFYFKYSDGSFSRISVARNTEWEHYTLTSTAGKTVVGVGLNNSHYVNYNYIDVNTFKLEEGATATPYTPYTTDFSGVEVSRYGKNFMLMQPIRKLKANFKDCFYLPKGTYTVSMNFVNATSWRFAFTLYDLKGNLITDVIEKPEHLSGISKVLNYSSANGGIYQNAENITSNSMTFKTDDNYYIGINFYFGNTTADTTATNCQLEIGTTATAYEPYKEPQTASATADGTVDGLTSLSPNMTLVTNTEGVTINCEYYRDIDTYIDNQMINLALTGGV